METEIFSSRKFILACVSLGLLVLGGIGAIFVPTIVSWLPTFVGGIIGIISVYMTGNIINKSVVLNSAGYAQAIDYKQTLALRNPPTVISQDATGTVVQENDDTEENSAA